MNYIGIPAGLSMARALEIARRHLRDDSAHHVGPAPGGRGRLLELSRRYIDSDGVQRDIERALAAAV